MTFAEHIDQLTAEHDIKVTSHSRGGRAWRYIRTVAIRPVRSSITYAIALHEIGHLLGRQPKLRMDRELAAWEWAKANAMYWSPGMQRTMDHCLARYQRKVDAGMIKPSMTLSVTRV